VIWPQAATLDMEDFSGFAFSQGFNPAYGKADPYRMALACADEACETSSARSRRLTRALARTSAAKADAADWSPGPRAEGLRDAAAGFGVALPPSRRAPPPRESRDLLFRRRPVCDVRKALTMDIKGPGNASTSSAGPPRSLGALFHEIMRLRGAVPKSRSAPRGILQRRPSRDHEGPGLSPTISRRRPGRRRAEMAFSGSSAFRSTSTRPRTARHLLDESFCSPRAPAASCLKSCPKRGPRC